MSIAVIGAGASGLTAAISAVRNGADPSSITIYEASNRPGRKILATGNGRCNLGNEFLDESCFYVSDDAGIAFLSDLIKSFSVSDVKLFFSSLDLDIVSKDGYLYPRSMQASSVLNALLTELDHMGVKIICNSAVFFVDCLEDGAASLHTEIDNKIKKEIFDKVIISTGLGAGEFSSNVGSHIYPDSENLFKHTGLFQNKPLPALCGISCIEDISAIAGVRARGRISLFSGNEFIGKDEGEIQFTKEFISGIPVFQVSRQASFYLNEGREVSALLDLLFEYSEEELAEILAGRIRRHPERKIYEIMGGILNDKLLKFIYLKSGISGRDKVIDIPDDKKNEFIHNCKNLKFDITGTEKKEKAQTMCGGIGLDKLTHNLELKDKKGLYVTGELLDIDGKCGGYNLYLAWATGLRAGKAAALSLNQ